MELITTEVIAEVLVHCPTVAVTAYEPAFAAFTLLITGFCNEEVKPFGPVHVYDAPVIVPAVRLIELPLHSVLLVETIGADGTVLTMAVTDAAALIQPFAVTATLYDPAFIIPAFVIVGF